MFALPSKILDYLRLQPGEKVADFGAGKGDYVLAAAAAVAPAGRVFAVDIQKELLDRIMAEARERQLGDVVETIWGDAETRGGVKLADASVDAVILTNIFFQVDSPYGLALEAKRVLRPDGRVLVGDWKDSYGGLGPAPAQIVLPAKAAEVMTSAGFAQENSFEAGDHHYGQIYVLKG